MWLVVAHRQPRLGADVVRNAADAAGVCAPDEVIQTMARMLDSGGGILPMFLMDAGEARWVYGRALWAWTEDRMQAKKFISKIEATDAARRQTSAWFFRVGLADEDAGGSLSYEER